MSSNDVRWLTETADGFCSVPVGREFEVALGKMLDEGKSSVDGQVVPYLRNANVRWGKIDLTDVKSMQMSSQELVRYRVSPGDLLVCEGGEPGRAAIWKGELDEVYYQKALHRLRSRGRSSVEWLYYCLLAAVGLNVFAVEGNLSTISHLTAEQLRAHRFPFPDRELQDTLVQELDGDLGASSKIAEKLSRQTAVVSERCKALIVGAVFGHVDVTTARGVTI